MKTPVWVDLQRAAVLRDKPCALEEASMQVSNMNTDTYIQWSLLWIEFHVPGHCKEMNKLDVIVFTVYIVLK